MPNRPDKSRPSATKHLSAVELVELGLAEKLTWNQLTQTVAREFDQEITDEEANAVLWNWTAYPMNSTVGTVEQLRRFFADPEAWKALIESQEVPAEDRAREPAP